MYLKPLLIFLFILVSSYGNAQNLQTIPAYTGYAKPAETWSAKLFDPQKGVTNWTNLQQQLEYHFYIRKTGSLELSMQVRNPEGASQLQVLFDKQLFIVNVPKSDKLFLLN